MFPSPWRSYVIYHSAIAGALTELGHEVWLCVPRHLLKGDTMTTPQNANIRFLSYDSDTMYENWNVEELLEEGHDSLHYMFKALPRIEKFIPKTFGDERFVESVKRLKPDLFVLEMSRMAINMVVLPYKFEVPFAFIGTMKNAILARTPFHPVTEPLIHLNVSDRMTFFQRVKITLIYAAYYFYIPYIYDSYVRKFAPEKLQLSIQQIILKAEIFLFETDHILDYPRTALPNIKFIGSSSAKEAKPLVGGFKEFADCSVNGLAVVSFGGINLQFPRALLNKMAAAFSRSGLNVIWRINQTFNATHSSRLMTSNWLPQNDLLGHPNTRLFISHCGKNSQYEALYHSVPMLCLPIHVDQFYNSERVRVKGFGVSTDLREVSSEDLAGLIHLVTYDPKYRSNIQKASRLYKELYRSPSKEAAYWLDHVMKYGGGYMRSPCQEMPLYQFLLLDVIGFCFVVMFTLVPILYCVLNRFYTFVYGKIISRSKLKLN
ncbi:UDP-glucuronosyltransferase 1-1 [Bulinus truncatus]|nr:UDP-glucuronosyltransferase 1-1 [Bulinus truncatus]